MPRPLRIQYPGAWYHVMNRCRRGEKIFTKKEDYWSFVDLLEELNEVFNVKISAYCMMANHYHLLVRGSSLLLALAYYFLYPRQLVSELLIFYVEV